MKTKTPAVAIIGTEGAGKTVLTAVLAKRLGDPEGGMFLNAQGPRTLKHVERVWNILQNGDWPEGNPAGELFELKWKLEIQGSVVCEVRFIECAGQDIRMLFEGEQFDGAPTPELRHLAQYCAQSDIYMFLINIGDFIGKKNPETRSSNEAAIKAAIDTLSRKDGSKRFCIVITQADLYRGELERLGSWDKVLKAHLGNLYGAHVHGGRARVFPVSAVSDTELRDDAEGRSIRVPKAGFGSEGLDELTSWLKNQTRKVSSELNAKANRERNSEPPVNPRPTAPPPNPPAKGKELGCASILAPIITSILCFLILPRTCTSSREVTGPDTRGWLEKLFGAPVPTQTVTETSWFTIVIITLILCFLAYKIARIIESDDSSAP